MMSGQAGGMECCASSSAVEDITTYPTRLAPSNGLNVSRSCVPLVLCRAEMRGVVKDLDLIEFSMSSV